MAATTEGWILDSCCTKTAVKVGGFQDQAASAAVVREADPYLLYYDDHFYGQGVLVVCGKFRMPHNQPRMPADTTEALFLGQRHPAVFLAWTNMST